jgi:hypothetical protein
MKIPQIAHIDNVFFCQNPVENCTQIFLRFYVNRDKSDVMTSFGMIDWSDVCRVFRQAGSSLPRPRYWNLNNHPSLHRALVLVGETQKLLKPTDMAIHWKVLEEHFMLVN